MDGTVIQGQGSRSQQRNHPAWWRRVWPAALGVLVAAVTAYGLTDGREVAPVVAASGLVYLAAAATSRWWAAWVGFGGTFALITLAKFTGLDALVLMMAAAVILVLVGIATRRGGPWWAFPLQTGAMLVLAVVALAAIRLDATAGGLLVAGALLCHAGWDIYHHRTRRVVDHTLAEFCGVLDILVAVVVAATALAG